MNYQITPDHVIQIDPEDAELIAKRHWIADRTVRLGKIAFVSTHGPVNNRGKILLHRYLTGVQPLDRVEFVSGDTLDLRRDNLRIKHAKGGVKARGVNDAKDIMDRYLLGEEHAEVMALARRHGLPLIEAAEQFIRAIPTALWNARLLRRSYQGEKA